MDNTPKAQEAIASLNPLCVLRYSATHRSKQNLVYRLTPVDAYQLGLVKQISVISNSVINDSNKPYIALKSVSGNNGFSAKIEMDIENATGKVERKIITVKPDDDLFIKSGHRKLYENYVVSGIDCTSGYECIEFANSETVELGQSIGSVDPDTIKRAMIIIPSGRIWTRSCVIMPRESRFFRCFLLTKSKISYRRRRQRHLCRNV